MHKYNFHKQYLSFAKKDEANTKLQFHKAGIYNA